MNRHGAVMLFLAMMCAVALFFGDEVIADGRGEMDLTIERVIELVLARNLSVGSAKHDIAMSDTGLQFLRSKYAPQLSIEGGYARQKLPRSGLTELTGDRTYQWEASAMIAKAFSTGTKVAAGFRSVYYDANDQKLELMGETLINSSPPYYMPRAFMSLQQDLLKNAFGVNDRIQEKIQENAVEMQKRAIVDAISGLVAGALMGYWEAAVGKSVVENARFELQSTRAVRSIIDKNVRFGLMDVYGLHQFDAIVAAAEAKLEIATQSYAAAVRDLLRMLKLPPETRIRIVSGLSENPPSMDLPAALNSAYAKRTDYRNALLEMENADMAVKMYENSDMPSLSVDVNLEMRGQDENCSPAVRDVSRGEYPSWSVYLRASHPLGDTGQAANLRNAALRVKQTKLGEERLRIDIRDEVSNRMEIVKLRHVVLGRSKAARSASELYYRRVLEKFGRGKVSSLDMKSAIDAMAQSRQQELESLVAYNVSLLQLDLSKNELFERYNVDVKTFTMKEAR